jgi:hypothetical protein
LKAFGHVSLRDDVPDSEATLLAVLYGDGAAHTSGTSVEWGGVRWFLIAHREDGGRGKRGEGGGVTREEAELGP